MLFLVSFTVSVHEANEPDETRSDEQMLVEAETEQQAEEMVIEYYAILTSQSNERFDYAVFGIKVSKTLTAKVLQDMQG